MFLSAFRVAFLGGVMLAIEGNGATSGSFVHWENPHVHPLELTPDATRILAVNTPDNRLEVFDVTTGIPRPWGSIPVGLDPVSVRARSGTEAWVVNHISDSVSIVDLISGNVVRTLATLDEPADVVFAGTPPRAFVSCSQANKVQVFDPADLTIAPIEIAIDAEDPRTMAVSPDGASVYVAIFESGNRSTILGGGAGPVGFFPPNVVSDPLGPYGGVNPPPNSGGGFDPPQNPANPPPPPAGLIVKQDAAGRWLDDNGGDWTELVSGPLADRSGRPVGWELLDRDVAIIDTATLGVSYATGLMNICMAIGVHPASGKITVVGTDATNQIRYEPNLNGRFLRVLLGLADPGAPTAPTVVDLNPHLAGYAAPTIPEAQRELSIGDPRGIVWNAAGTRGYVAGMGSSNVVVFDASGARAGPSLAVGQGPTGVVLDESRARLYVLNKFGSSISAVDTTSMTELTRVAFHDPSPPAVKLGRRHLYDTHETSGLGHAACASCHVDARIDRLAWDLGDPAGAVRTFNQNCNSGSPSLGPGPCPPWHPMKGPMVTQTFQDIVGKEPHHWRGDRDGLEEFNQTFTDLQGDDEMPTALEMQEFEDFLATIHFPPNPFRNFDNTLPTALPLPGHYFAGVGGPIGTPLPPGDAAFGRNLFRDHHVIQGFAHTCHQCHTLPTGVGTNQNFSGGPAGVPVPPGPNGELHHTVVFSHVSETPNMSIKVPHLRNQYEKVGFEMTQSTSRAGFGFLHDGSVDSLARFMTEPAFNFDTGIDGTPARKVAGMVAFMLAFAGSDLPVNGAIPGPTSRDTHAAAGAQLTVHGANNGDPQVVARLGAMLALANAPPPGTAPGPRVSLVTKGLHDGLQRGYAYTGGGVFQSDRAGETIGTDALRTSAAAGAELTFTVVPRGTETRIGIDRDEDGFLDRNEQDACSDPTDPASTPGAHVQSPRLTVRRSGTTTLLSWTAIGASWDVVQGDLDALRASAGDFSASIEECSLEDGSVPAQALPDAGESGNFFYLVRAACAGGTTWDSGGATQQGSRDEEIDASAQACSQ